MFWHHCCFRLRVDCDDDDGVVGNNQVDPVVEVLEVLAVVAVVGPPIRAIPHNSTR